MALHASTRLPSVVAIMLPMTPPLDGITQVWKRSPSGSHRTNVSWRTPDSLYQIVFPMATIRVSGPSIP